MRELDDVVPAGDTFMHDGRTKLAFRSDDGYAHV
jgi:hypothetical protein